MTKRMFTVLLILLFGVLLLAAAITGARSGKNHRVLGFIGGMPILEEISDD